MLLTLNPYDKPHRSAQLRQAWAKRFPKKRLYCALLWLLASCHDAGVKKPSALVLEDGAKVVASEVVKGDEFWARDHADWDGGKTRVRLLGVVAFSAVQQDAEVLALAKAGDAALKKLLAGQKIQIKLGTPSKDIHGRYLAYAQSRNHSSVNQEMIAQGAAATYTEYPFAEEKAHFAAEALARQNKLGIWNSPKGVHLLQGLRRLWQSMRQEQDPHFKDPWLASLNVALPQSLKSDHARAGGEVE